MCQVGGGWKGPQALQSLRGQGRHPGSAPDGLRDPHRPAPRGSRRWSPFPAVPSRDDMNARGYFLVFGRELFRGDTELPTKESIFLSPRSPRTGFGHPALGKHAHVMVCF